MTGCSESGVPRFDCIGGVGDVSGDVTPDTYSRLNGETVGAGDTFCPGETTGVDGDGAAKYK